MINALLLPDKMKLLSRCNFPGELDDELLK